MGNKSKKRKKWPFVLIVVILLAVIAALLVPRLLMRGFGNMTGALVASAEVTAGDVSTTVTGSGNLADDVKTVKLPYGVTVSEILAESGDEVREGDVLATVNASSVASRVAEVKASLEDLGDELDDLIENKTETVSVKSKTAARVKKIYAAEENETAGVIAENGSLMLLSLDGRMAVTFKSETELAAGSGVTVVSSDGTEREGKILSASDGIYIVTLSDDGPVLGDAVTVKTEAGTMGSGVLYIHEPLRITAERGRVASIDVAENESVSVGETLLTISKPTAGRAYASLIAKRAELLDTLEQLTALAASGEICAPAKGTVGKVSVTEGAALSKETTDDEDTDTGTGADASSTPQANASSLAAAADAMRLNASGQSDAGEDAAGTAAGGANDGATDQTTDGAINQNPETTPETNPEINAELAVFGLSPIAVSPIAETDDAETDAEDPSEETEPTYNNAGTAFTVIASDTFALNVSVDELDIAAVKVGQETTVEIDAIEGETFTGKVIEVSDTTDESSGSSNYSATIEIGKVAGMKSGMSATATIQNEKRTNVLTIPLEAVQEFGDEIFVYTSLDENGNFGGRADIETGLSDGVTVEVIEGLEAGDIVYYQQSVSDDSNSMMFGMRGGGAITSGGPNGDGPSFDRSDGPPAGGGQGGFGGGQ
ncbi:MAG: HlyD family efflux transporter periplasmic adaptor subunit [Clostridiales Family XIII bacterium]|jgi:multidrug efflux pump subunit AcrA (membrane-fusion protein)|nr:HlyD family efflux transporter periplasmic adaptor subunit [Clostridiales Family XIII bacterium]